MWQGKLSSSRIPSSDFNVESAVWKCSAFTDCAAECASRTRQSTLLWRTVSGCTLLHRQSSRTLVSPSGMASSSHVQPGTARTAASRCALSVSLSYQWTTIAALSHHHHRRPSAMRPSPATVTTLPRPHSRVTSSPPPSAAAHRRPTCDPLASFRVLSSLSCAVYNLCLPVEVARASSPSCQHLKNSNLWVANLLRPPAARLGNGSCSANVWSIYSALHRSSRAGGGARGRQSDQSTPSRVIPPTRRRHPHRPPCDTTMTGRHPLPTHFLLSPMSKVFSNLQRPASMYVHGTFWVRTFESDQAVEARRWRPP